MSTLTEAIRRSFVAGEHRDPVWSRHRPLGRRQLTGFEIAAQAVATTAPAASLVLLPVYLVSGPSLLSGSLIIGVAIVTCCLIANVLSQFTERVAASGGLYTFVAKGSGPQLALLAGACLILKYLGSAAISMFHVGITIATVAELLGVPSGGTGTRLLTIVVAGIIQFAIMAVGVRRAAVAILVVEVLSLILITGLIFVPAQDIELPASTVGGSPALMIMFAMFALAGFESAAFFGPETRRGIQMVSRAIRWTPALCGLLLALQVLATLTGHTNALVQIYLSPAGSQLPPVVVIALHVGLTFSWLGTATASVNAGSRLVYTMGVEGVLPRMLGRVSETFRTPTTAIGAVVFTMAGISCFFTLHGISSALFGEFRLLTRIGLLLAYWLTVVAAVLFLRRINELTCRVLVAAVLAGLAIMIMTVMVLMRNPESRGLSMMVLIMVVACWGIGLRWKGRTSSIGVFDRAESVDALPGAVEVTSNRTGERVLVGRDGGDGSSGGG